MFIRIIYYDYYYYYLWKGHPGWGTEFLPASSNHGGAAYQRDLETWSDPGGDHDGPLRHSPVLPPWRHRAWPGDRHRSNGHLAQRVPSLFLACSFRMCLHCEVLEGMFAWRTRYPLS